MQFAAASFLLVVALLISAQNHVLQRLALNPERDPVVIINNDIALAICLGELFVQLQLDWKKKMELAGVKPFLFGYTWSGGNWPGYVADVRSAALGGYGADQGDRFSRPERERDVVHHAPRSPRDGQGPGLEGGRHRRLAPPRSARRK